MYINEISRAETKDYKNMLIQGIMMFFWLDQNTTIQSLGQLGHLENICEKIL
jgi:hypothetical protein